MRLPILMLALSACTPKPELAFPEDFLWGTATAGFQVDMGCPTWSDDVCVDTASDWYQWVNDDDVIGDRDLFTTGDDVRLGPGMWELFEQDVEQLQRDHHGVYRMSVEWSRLFPDAAAADAQSVDDLVPLANPAAVARYHEMFDALHDAGIVPVVTVNHYTLPLWIHDGIACRTDPECEAAGWASDRIVPHIARFSGFLGREYGADIDLWATQNEPFANTLAGYVQPGEFRVHPPGRTFDGPAAVASIFHQIEAHAAMYDALHAEDIDDADDDGTSASVGTVLNVVAVEPRDPDSAADQVSAAHLDYVYHRVYLDAVTAGAWDDDVDGTADRTRDDLADRLDWLGVNYYNVVRAGSLGSLRPLPEVPVMDFFPEIIDEAIAEGLGPALDVAAEYDVPIYITEVGTRFDAERVDYLDDLVRITHDKLDAGMDIRGFFWWSYVDNYEWNHGFEQQFGMYAYDPVSKERTPREVAIRFAETARVNGLPKE